VGDVVTYTTTETLIGDAYTDADRAKQHKRARILFDCGESFWRYRFADAHRAAVDADRPDLADAISQTAREELTP
jgi:hypothetical protein